MQASKFGWVALAGSLALFACDDGGMEVAGSGASSGTGGSGGTAGNGGDGACGLLCSGDQYLPVRITEFDTELSSTSLAITNSNAFVMAAHDPFSTFAPNLNTASYDGFIAGAAITTARETLRIEDFVNAFDYGYSAPSADAVDPLAIVIDAAPHPLGRSTVLLRVAAQGANALSSPKPPANVVLVVPSDPRNTSAPQWLARILNDVVHNLEPTDTIAIVNDADAGAGSVLLPPTPIADRSTIDAVSAALWSSSDTDAGLPADLDAGATARGPGTLRLAYAQADAGRRAGSVNHIVVLAATAAAHGLVTGGDEAVTLAAAGRTAGTTLSVVSLHGIFPIDVYLADAGGGRATSLRRQDQAEVYVQHDLLPYLVPIARDVHVDIETNPARVKAHRLLGYERYASAPRSGPIPVTDVSRDIGVGHQVTVLYELVLADGAIPMPDGAPAPIGGAAVPGTREVNASDLVRVTVSYQSPNAQAGTPRSQVVSVLAADAIATSASALGQDFEWAAAVASFTELLRRSPFSSEGELTQAQSIINAQANRDPDRAELASKVGSWTYAMIHAP